MSLCLGEDVLLDGFKVIPFLLCYTFCDPVFRDYPHEKAVL